MWKIFISFEMWKKEEKNFVDASSHLYKCLWLFVRRLVCPTFSRSSLMTHQFAKIDENQCYQVTRTHRWPILGLVTFKIEQTVLSQTKTKNLNRFLSGPYFFVWVSWIQTYHEIKNHREKPISPYRQNALPLAYRYARHAKYANMHTDPYRNMNFSLLKTK